ncbi:RdgB/HAM1 family non-canonical purine NTP pyrophosphatase [[Eubacterium] cellulosolvens]
MSQIILVTTNRGKTREIDEILRHYQIQVKNIIKEKVEIQSLSLKEVVKYAAISLSKEIAEPYIIEDAGLFIDRLKGFPGPYSSYVYKTLGVEGVITLLAGVRNRKAEFRSAIAFHSKKTGLKIFEKSIWGEISYKALGLEGFGFDPIFISAEGDGRTFAQMSLQEKNKYSHRSKAVKAFAKWYLSSDNT